MKRTGVGGGEPQSGMAGDWFDQVPAAAAVLAPDGSMIRCNDEAVELLDRFVTGQSGSDFAHGTAWFDRLTAAVARDGTGMIVIARRRGRQRVALEVRGRTAADGNMLVVLRDCTGCLNARRVRAHDERRQRSFMDRLPDPLLIEQGGRIVYLNPAAADLAGDTIDRLAGQPLSRFLPDDVARRLKHVLATEAEVGPIETEVVCANGTAVVQVDAVTLQYRQRPAVQLHLRDVTARVQAEAGLRATHERLRLITDIVRDHAILNIDVTRAIVSWNATAERLTGYAADAIIRAPVTTITSDDDADVASMFGRCDEDGRCEAEIGIRRLDGTMFRAHVTLAAQHDLAQAVIGYTMIVRDLSEQLRAEEELRRSEEQLRHSQKMDAVGRLAAGIAHDFNNVLTAIQGHVQFLLEDLPEDFPSREDASEIRRAAERATQLTRQLLTFARRQPSRPVPMDLNAVITDLEKLLSRLIRADVQLHTELVDVPHVFADPGQIEQVIMNLVVNARDSMPQGGTIKVRTSTIRFDEAYIARGLSLAPGEYVQMSISDTGCGIPDEVQRHIFEPFFTTKAEGTGLGLSTVYGITTQSGGHVSVYSEEGVGTTFKVFLPVREAAHPRAERVSAPEEETSSGSILLVEDDDAVRALARRTLEGRGFTVTEASDGEAALAAAKQVGDSIDVVVTDLMMPRMSGEDLAERVAALHPHIGIVLMSGFPEASLGSNGRAQLRRHFLEKPFTPETLVQTVRRAMSD